MTVRDDITQDIEEHIANGTEHIARGVHGDAEVDAVLTAQGWNVEAARTEVIADGALWRMIGDPPARTASGADRERYGAGVCVTGACVEPCGRDGGCSR